MQKQDFKKALGVLKDMKISLFLSDNQLIEGILLDVKQDHLVVNVNQNIFYIALEHIQGLSKHAKGFRVSPQVIPYLNKDNLTDVLMALQYHWVSVNSLGKQAFLGVLSKISEDHITLIDNMEQLYIQKSYISNIYKGKYEIKERKEHIDEEPAIAESSSHTNTETKEQLESSVEEEIEHYQHNEDVIAKQVQITNKSVSEKHVELPIKVKPIKVETDSVKVTNELLETHLMTEIIKEHNILQLDTQDLLVKTEDNKPNEEPIQEIIIRDIASRMNDELKKEQLDSSAKKGIKLIQHEEQVMIKQMQSKNIKESKKQVDTNVSNETLEDIPRTGVMDTQNSLNIDEKNSLKIDQQDMLKSKNSIRSEEQLMLNEALFRHEKKRRLITSWSTMKNNQEAISHNNGKESESVAHEDEKYKVSRRLKRYKRSKRLKSLTHPTGDNTSNNKLKCNENFDISIEKPKSTETNTSPLSLIEINPKEEKANLERQYYALMNHASRNAAKMQQFPKGLMPLEIFFLPVRKIRQDEEGMIKKQYDSLMKHAEKMYCQLKDERLKNEI